MHPRPSATPSTATPLTVLVDETRAFPDRRPHLQVRRGDHAVELLRSAGEREIDNLWLDYDLLDGTTSAAAADHLVARAERGGRLSINLIEGHSARVPETPHVTQHGGATRRSSGRDGTQHSTTSGVPLRVAAPLITATRVIP